MLIIWSKLKKIYIHELYIVCSVYLIYLHTPSIMFIIPSIEVFLKERAKHPPHCYRAYDALRLCLIQKIDTVTCGKIVEAYRPCARELRKEKLKRVMSLEEERRKMLAAKAKILEEKQG